MDYDDLGYILNCMNSYAKHCGDNATQCAEEDLLGQALDALRESLRLTKDVYLEGPEHNDLADNEAAILIILAKAAETYDK